MEISGSGNGSLLDAVIAKQSGENQREIAVLKKAQDVQKQQGEAAVALIEAAASGLGQQVDFSA
jgi:hypothetical protein